MLAKRSELSFVTLARPLIEFCMQVLYINQGQQVSLEIFWIGLPTISSNVDRELCFLGLSPYEPSLKQVSLKVLY